MFIRNVIIGICVLLASCRSQDPSAPELSLESVPEPRGVVVGQDACGGSLEEADLFSVDGRYRVVVASADAVRSGRCEPTQPHDRLCRALFLIAVTDPLAALGLGVDAELLDELIDHHRWSIKEGIAAAEASGNPSAAAALTELSALGLADALAAGSNEVAALASRRAARSIIEPIAEAESGCSER